MIDWLYINWPTLSGTLATIAVGVATVVVTIRLARPRMSLIYEIVVGAAATFRDYGVKPLPALSPLEVWSRLHSRDHSAECWTANHQQCLFRCLSTDLS